MRSKLHGTLNSSETMARGSRATLYATDFLLTNYLAPGALACLSTRLSMLSIAGHGLRQLEPVRPERTGRFLYFFLRVHPVRPSRRNLFPRVLSKRVRAVIRPRGI